MHRVRRFSLLPLLILALLAVALLGPLSAGAAPAGKGHLARTKQNSQSSPASNLLYHGGPVMGGTAHAYAIFWEPSGSFVSSTYNSLIKRYFSDIGSSPLYHNNTQYKDSGGHIPSNAVFTASWVDTAAYPSGTLSDGQIQGEVTHAQSVNGWTSSIDNIFFVFTAKNENICFDSSHCSFTFFCAYHSSFGSNTLYAAMPYTGTSLAACGVPNSPNHDFDADSTINVTSHEQNEAATDPLGSAWFDAAGNEIGDKCSFNFGKVIAGGGDVSWNGHHYMVQKEWDNARSKCRLSGP